MSDERSEEDLGSSPIDAVAHNGPWNVRLGLLLNQTGHLHLDLAYRIKKKKVNKACKMQKYKNTKAKSDRNELGLNGGVCEVPMQKYRPYNL